MANTKPNQRKIGILDPNDINERCRVERVIAIYLGCYPSEIEEIRVWNNVVWVKVKGHRPTFVSRKAIAYHCGASFKNETPVELQDKNYQKFDQNTKADRQRYQNQRIAPVPASLPAAKFFPVELRI